MADIECSLFNLFMVANISCFTKLPGITFSRDKMIFLLKNTKHIRSIDAICVSFKNVQLWNDSISKQGYCNWMYSPQKEKEKCYWTISDISWWI